MIRRTAAAPLALLAFASLAVADDHGEARPWSIEEMDGACADPVLMIVSGAVSDAGFQRRDDRPGYGEALRASGVYERFGGWYAAVGRPIEVFEGEFGRELMLVAEFPCADAARNWFYSTDYQAIIPLRDGAGDFRLAIWDKREKAEMNWMAAAAERGGPAAPVPAPRTARYACSDGAVMEVAFGALEAQVIYAGSQPRTLPAADTPRGFHFADEAYRLRGLSTSASFETPDGEAVICVERE